MAATSPAPSSAAAPSIDAATLLAGIPLVHSSPLMRLWRDTYFGYVSLDEDIDDARSVAWRGTVDAHVDAAGAPRFMILDVHRVTATNSIAMRFKSATWARNALLRLGQVSVFTGSNHKSMFIIHTILRLTGMANVTVLDGKDGLEACVAAYRAGRGVDGVPVRAV